MESEKGLFGYLPVSLFGSVMGLCGLGIAWEEAWDLYEVPFVISQVIDLIAVLAFVALVIAYGLKIITNFKSFVAEFKNPLLRSFFGTFIISLLLLPIVIYRYVPNIALGMWVIGAILMLVFAWHMVSFWLCSTQEIGNVTPAWIIPVVGTLDAPLASHLFGDSADIYYLDVLFLSIGLFFALPIITLIFSRLLFFDKLPDKLMPSLMILIAPFSVGFSAYLTVNPEVDLFGMGLFFLGLFVFFVLLPQIFAISRCCPFRVTWWAVSFPLSALLVSILKMAKEFDSFYLDILSWVFLSLVSLVILWLLLRTLKGVFDGELKNLS